MGFQATSENETTNSAKFETSINTVKFQAIIMILKLCRYLIVLLDTERFWPMTNNDFFLSMGNLKSIGTQMSSPLYYIYFLYILAQNKIKKC